jgi:hypothetical protein
VNFSTFSQRLFTFLKDFFRYRGTVRWSFRATGRIVIHEAGIRIAKSQSLPDELGAIHAGFPCFETGRLNRWCSTVIQRRAEAQLLDIWTLWKFKNTSKSVNTFSVLIQKITEATFLVPTRIHFLKPTDRKLL